MHRMPIVVGCFCIIAFVTGSGDAAKVKVWHHQSQAQFDKGKLKQATVSSEGAVRLSRGVKSLANLQALSIWGMVEDKTGSLFVATGDEGKIFKVTPDGKVALAFTSTDSQILSMTAGPDGSIYAGTGPTGQLIKIAPDGSTRVLANDLDSYVWALVYDPASQSVFAATGPKGRIFQVNGEGKASVYYTTKQEHILCLAAGPKNTLYAGTDKGGLVYRIDGKNKGFVLYHAQQSEVRTLLVTAEAVYAGTSSPTARRPGFGKSGDTPAQPGAATVNENSVYRIAGDGTVREIFREKALVLCLAQQNGKLLVGTGMHGQVLEIDENTKEKSELARLDHGQILCMLRRQSGELVLGTGDPGKLYTLEDKFAAAGSLTSDVLDAKIISKWGALNWKANTPAGTSVKLAIRTGNVAEPDDTWSAWSAEQTDPQESKIVAPPARYLQYRITLASDNPKITPELRSLSLRYKTTNQAPEITSLEVPDLDAGNLDNAKKLKIRWSATDPNDDELTYRLYFKKEGWKEWILLEDDLERKDFDWDTTTVPSGMYQIKVVASDRKDNSPEETLTAKRTSGAFPVSHTPPSVTLKMAGFDGDQAVLEAIATSPLVRLTEASFAVNGKRWTPIFPSDGLFDSKTEIFRFKTDSLRPGSHVLTLRVRDAAGNVGAADVTFRVSPMEK